MPSSRAPLLLATLGGLMMVACQVGLQQPLPPSQVALQRADVPADLQRCPSSGSVDGYVKKLAAGDPQGRAAAQQGWRQLQTAGAVEGAMSVYSLRLEDCQKQPGARGGRLAA